MINFGRTSKLRIQNRSAESSKIIEVCTNNNLYKNNNLNYHRKKIDLQTNCLNKENSLNFNSSNMQPRSRHFISFFSNNRREKKLKENHLGNSSRAPNKNIRKHFLTNSNTHSEIEKFENEFIKMNAIYNINKYSSNYVDKIPERKIIQELIPLCSFKKYLDYDNSCSRKSSKHSAYE